MLILTRRNNERIFIGDNIVLSILTIEGNRVKVGIDAPKDVTILREEIKNTPVELQVVDTAKLKVSGED